jgi:hypothetical protein
MRTSDSCASLVPLPALHNTLCSDRTFKPIYAYWAEKGQLPGSYRGRAAQPKRGNALNRQPAVLSAVGGSNTAAGEGGPGAGGGCGSGAVLELVGGGGVSVLPAPEDLQSSNALTAARAALATSAPPAQLPCRCVRLRSCVGVGGGGEGHCTSRCT